MSRPSPKPASQNFTLRPVSLPESKRQSLLNLLGYSDETLAAAATPGYEMVERQPGASSLVKKSGAPFPYVRNPFSAIRLIEAAIAMATEGATHLNNPPRASDYRAEFAKMQSALLPVLVLLNSWSEYYRDQITFHGQDFQEIRQTISALYGLSGDVISSMKGETSKGAPRQNALILAIRQLRQIFRKFYCGTQDDAKRTEAKFVRLALEAGRVIRPEYEGLNKLMRDIRCDIDEPTPEGWRLS